ncbi:MAG: hypothetical protein SFY96_06980 [Planctomycetota bacterium]|nr:hypothetical protein [Planctomycetota bacterium]
MSQATILVRLARMQSLVLAILTLRMGLTIIGFVLVGQLFASLPWLVRVVLADALLGLLAGLAGFQISASIDALDHGRRRVPWRALLRELLMQPIPISGVIKTGGLLFRGAHSLEARGVRVSWLLQVPYAEMKRLHAKAIAGPPR